jgi:hypothetical protein
MARVFGRNHLAWHGDILKLDRRELARLVPDTNYPIMWRVLLLDGHLTDMLNHTRAKDAALALALATLNRKSDVEETAQEAAQTGFSPPPLPNPPPIQITALSSAA